jgi:PAS domain S-box-containing protein
MKTFPKTTDSPSPSALSLPLHLGLCSLAYFAAQMLSFQFPDSFGLVAAIWPAAGIALASLLLSPRRHWPALLACLFASGIAANLTTTRPFLATVGFMIANISETAASAWLITRWGGEKVRFTQMREVLALAGAVFLVNTATSLVGAGTATLALGAQFWAFYSTWWISDGLGLLLITPLIVVWASSWRTLSSWRWRRILETTGLFLLSCAMAWFIFGSRKFLASVEIRPYFLSVFIIWAALRSGVQGTVTLLVAFSLIAIGCTAAGLGSFPLGGEEPQLRLLSVQVFLGVMGLTGLVLAAAIAQQRASQALLHAVVEGTSDAVYVKDRQGRYVLLNSAALRLVGKTASEVLGKDDTFLFSPEDAKAVMQEDQVSMALTAPRTYEERVIRRDGEPRFFLSTKGPMQGEAGDVVGLFGIARDITARKQAEAALHQSEARFRAIATHTPDHILMQDRDLRYIFVINPQLGLKEADMIGKTEQDFLAQEDAAKLVAIKRKVLESGEAVELEIPLQNLKGQTEYFEGSYIPTFDLTGKADGLIGYFRNVTARKQTEAALARSRAELKTIYDHAPVMMCVVDAQRQILYANPAFTAFTGALESDLLGGRACGVFGCLNALEDPRGCGFGADCSQCALRLAIEDTFKTGVGHHNVEHLATLVRGADRRAVVLLAATALLRTDAQPCLLLCLHEITA